MAAQKILYDISVLLGEEAIDYPGDTPFSVQAAESIRQGDGCNLSRLVMSAHAGTHIDMPAHFIENGGTLDSYEAGDFIFPAQVVEIPDRPAIPASALTGLDIAPGSALLFKTKNSTDGRCRSGRFSEDFVYLTSEAADLCVEKQAGLVGIDYITIERFGDEAFPVHRKLLGSGIFILEGLNLEAPPPGRYTLFAFPLWIKGAEASPVRAVLTR